MKRGDRAGRGSHADLVQALADYLALASDRLIWAETAIGSRWLERSVPVPDVLTMRLSYTRPDIAAYECKASTSDLGSDLAAGKYRRYFEISNRLFFAAPKGMVTKAQVPAEVGLIVHNPEKRTWSVVKAAPRRECDLDRLAWQALLFAHCVSQREVRSLRVRGIEEDNLTLRDRAIRVGMDLGRWNAKEAAEDQVEQVGLALKEHFPGDDWPMYRIREALATLARIDQHRKNLHTLAEAARELLRNGLFDDTTVQELAAIVQPPKKEGDS